MVINMDYKITTRDEQETIQIAQNIESEKFEDTLVDNEDFDLFLEQDFELDQIKDAMQNLDALSREIVFLRFIEDKSYAEIEEQLLISQDTIRQRISRALKKLKDILNP